MIPRRIVRALRVAAVVLAAGYAFGPLGCVGTGADIVGTGLTLTGASGLLGPGSQTAAAVGAGLDLFSDVVQFAPALR